MQQSGAFEQQLRATYAAIVAESFDRARHCLGLARVAQQAGDCAQVRKWMWSVRVLRLAASEWRKKAQQLAPMLVCLVWCLGCAKAPPPPQEFTANFDVQPGPDGRSVVWSLHFTVPQYHAMLESTVNGGEGAKIHELIAAGLRSNHIAGCSSSSQAATKLANGEIAFVGSCDLGAHAVPAGGI
jgi:hypothetical protein